MSYLGSWNKRFMDGERLTGMLGKESWKGNGMAVKILSKSFELLIERRNLFFIDDKNLSWGAP